jgi:hypothetical protein
MAEHPFEALGLSADADRAYPLLIATPGVAAAEPARRLEVLGEQAESACGQLAARGLAERGPDGPWYPLPPQAGLLPPVSRAEEQLRRGRGLPDRLGVVYRRVHEGHRAEQIVRPVQGAAAIRGRVAALHAAARKELLFLARESGVIGADPRRRPRPADRLIILQGNGPTGSREEPCPVARPPTRPCAAGCWSNAAGWTPGSPRGRHHPRLRLRPRRGLLVADRGPADRRRRLRLHLRQRPAAGQGRRDQRRRRADQPDLGLPARRHHLDGAAERQRVALPRGRRHRLLRRRRPGGPDTCEDLRGAARLRPDRRRRRRMAVGEHRHGHRAGRGHRHPDRHRRRLGASAPEVSQPGTFTARSSGG